MGPLRPVLFLRSFSNLYIMTIEQKLLGVLIGLELIACVVIYDMVYNVLPELPTAVAVAVSIG